MTRWKTALTLLAAAPLAGCVYTNVALPLDSDLDRTELGSKVGRSQIHSVMGLVAWGDAGIHAAAEEGGLHTLNHADREVFLVLMGLYARQTTVVYGE